MKVVFTIDYGNENFDKVRALGYEVVLIPEKEIQDSTFPYDADAFCCFNPFDRIDMNKFTNLKMLQLTSIGFDFVPKEDILKNNIVMTNNQGGYSIPMGEFIVFNMLQMAKRNRQFIQTQEEKKWKVDFSLTELYGKTALFLGTGTIAAEGAKRLQGFSMNVIGMKTKGTAAQYFDKVYPMDQYKEIFPQADFVISTLPATEQTYHFMNKESMSYLKNSACIINVSRGAIFDQEDLTQMLVDKKLAGAALDVFEIEPLPTESRLWDLENVYLYPHNSWVSEPMQDRRFDTMYENLRRLIQGEKLMNVVNIPRGY